MQELFLDTPRAFQVIQRHGYDPRRSRPGQPDGPRLGHARVGLGGVLDRGTDDGAMTGEFRVVLLPRVADDPASAWSPASLEIGSDRFEMEAEVPAGGWFRVEVRLLAGGAVVASGAVEPVGVGEVFVVAGQSYACSAHEAMMTVSDPFGRVSATSPESASWRIAHDPQPAIVERMDDRTRALLVEWSRTLDLGFPYGAGSPFRGSVWPPAMNHLLPLLHVPVGLVHCGLGATTIAQWEKPGQLFANLRDAVTMAADYRAVLWAQGESDSMEGTDTAAYRDALVRIRADLVGDTGLDRPWLVAKSTIHPASARDAVREEAIRAAIDETWQRPGFFPGPDTDLLDGLGVHRADTEHGGHFTRLGQERAGAMWFAAIWNLLSQVKSA